MLHVLTPKLGLSSLSYTKFFISILIFISLPSSGKCLQSHIFSSFSDFSTPFPNLAQFPQPLLANNLTFPPVSPRQPITLSLPQVPTAQSLHWPVNKHAKRKATEVPSLGSAFRAFQQLVMPLTNERIFFLANVKWEILLSKL